MGRTPTFGEDMRIVAIDAIRRTATAEDAANVLRHELPSGVRVPSVRWLRNLRREILRPAVWPWSNVPREERDDPQVVGVDGPEQWALSMARMARDCPDLLRVNPAKLLKQERYLEALVEALAPGSDVLFLARTAADIAYVAELAGESSGRETAELLRDALAIVDRGGKNDHA